MGAGGSIAWYSSPAIDADAQAFITAANITDTEQKNAIKTLVTQLKTNGTWSKYHAIYPYVGGSALAHSINLKNPAQFQIAWFGGVTHDAFGVAGNGVTGYGDTGYIPNTHGTSNNNQISSYSRSPVTKGSVMTAASNDPDRAHWGIELKSTAEISMVLTGSDRDYWDFNSAKLGYFSASKTPGGRLRNSRNGLLMVQGQSTQQTPLPVRPMAILAANSDGFIENFSNANIAFSTIGLGLTQAEAVADYSAVQAYQTSLGRSV